MPMIGIPRSLAGELFGGSEDPDQPPARPLLEAQCDELRRHFEAYQERYNWTPGDLAVEKRALGLFREDAEFALIFWRWLDLTSPLDQDLAQQTARAHYVNRVDCMVGMLSFEKGTWSVRIRPFDSAALQPLPAPAGPVTAGGAGTVTSGGASPVTAGGAGTDAAS